MDVGHADSTHGCALRAKALHYLDHKADETKDARRATARPLAAAPYIEEVTSLRADRIIAIADDGPCEIVVTQRGEALMLRSMSAILS